MKNPKIIFTVLFLFFLFTVCLAQKVTKEDEQKAKGLVPPEDKALLYVVRPSSVGWAFTFSVRVDAEPIGDLFAGTFVFYYLTPGKHVVLAKTEHSNEIEINAEGGKTYFMEETINNFAVAKVILKLLNEEDGRKKLSKCKLSASSLKNFID